MQYTIVGSKYGIAAGDFVIDVPEVIDGVPLYGQDGKDNFPRNESESMMLQEIIAGFQAQQNVITNNTSPEAGLETMTVEEEQQLKMDQFREMQIKDPIRADLNLAEQKAEASSFQYAGDITEQLGNLMPGFGGSMLDFSPSALGEAYGNLLLKGAPDDPKRFMGDMSVIASDIFLAGLSLGNVKFADKKNFNIPLFTNESRRQGLRGYLEKNPVKSTVAVNVLARAGSDAVYDMLNETYRWLQDIPADQTDDAAVENILNIRNEILWSGGAGGLAKLFPYIKPFIGKNFLGIDKEAQRLATLGRTHNIPMSAFNVTNSGLVQGLPPVVGLFPIVATNARIAQNAQLASAYTQMLKNIETFSPVQLFNDAGLLIDDGFRKMISEYGVMKGVLYNNVAKYADALNGESFIPTSKIKEMATAMRLAKTKGQIPMQQTPIQAGPNDYVYGQATSFDELMKGIKGSGADIENALMQFDSLPDNLNAQQFKSLIEGLNQVKRNMPNLKLSENSDEALMINDFHSVALQALNNPKSWKTMKGEQAAIAKEWADSYTVANDFIFQNADSLQGRTAMLLKQTDPNIAIPGGVQRPGYLYADQMAKIFFDDQTITSPMALKEMRKAFGDDAFNASTSAYFNNILNQSTDFVNGKIRIYDNDIGIWKQTKQYVTGKQATPKTQTINYNIPVMDIEKVADAFSLNDINRRAGVLEMFKAQVPGSEAVKTKHAEGVLNQISEVLELARAVEVPNYGDVSSFVKRRGVLGGLGSIANLFTGGALLANPISSAGVMLMARFGMNALSDPKFLDGMTKVLDPSLSDVARKSALVTIGRGVFDPVRAVNSGYDINNINDIIELITIGDMEQSPAYNVRAEDEYDEQSRVPEAIRGERQFNTATSEAPSGFNMPQGGFTPTDMSALETASAAPSPINNAQRVALAGGNLDEAIALRSNANAGLGSLRQGAA
ncbi:hypothetical protein OAC44_00810 [bacterium]|nr:hypothetical protein [bacterium]